MCTFIHLYKYRYEYEYFVKEEKRMVIKHFSCVCVSVLDNDHQELFLSVCVFWITISKNCLCVCDFDNDHQELEQNIVPSDKGG